MRIQILILGFKGLREFCSVLTATGSTAAISDANVNACIALKLIPILPDTPNRDNPVKEGVTIK